MWNAADIFVVLGIHRLVEWPKMKSIAGTIAQEPTPMLILHVHSRNSLRCELAIRGVRPKEASVALSALPGLAATAMSDRVRLIRN